MIHILMIIPFLLAIGSIASARETKETKLAHASNDLAFDILRQYKNDKNVFISPFSISTALAMVYLGADGHTSEVIRQVLKYQQYDLTEADVHEAFQSVSNSVKQNADDYIFSTFNDVLVQRDFTILHTYGEALRQYYSAKIETVDFESQGDEIKNRINEAVENSTRGKIQEFLDQPPSAETKIFILNAVYFLGNWKNPFNPELSFNGSFYNNGITEKEILMMHRDSQYAYSSSSELDASLLVIPYKGDDGADMVIVLPREKTGVAQVQELISQDILNGILNSTTVQRVSLTVPRFSMSYSAQLVDALTNLGLGELFSNNANLTRIAGEQAGLKVSKILHKAVIDVNERGSEAGAATGIEIVPLSLPPSFRVDRPFLFFIREKKNGMILFSGRVDEL